MEREMPVYPTPPAKAMREMDALIFQKISDMERSLTEHEEREEKLFEEILEAFPDGVQNHRTAHQAMIDASHAQKKFWDDLRMDLIHKGVWSIIAVLAGLVVTGVAAKLGILK